MLNKAIIAEVQEYRSWGVKTLAAALVLLWGAFPHRSYGQRHELLSERIATLQVTPNNDWMAPPVINLGSGDVINIAFDDLTHEYHRYVYRVEHCEADWTTSEELFTSDYIDGFADGQAINDLEESINTNVLYTHYRLQIPNEDCRIKMSGNYRVTIYDTNDDDREVLKACFMVAESAVGISMSVTTNTDLDINGRYQQVEMDIGYSGLQVTDPSRQITTVVTQNQRWDNAVVGSRPQFVRKDGLRWSHNRDFIFPGGNEYRKFELLDVSHSTMGLEAVDWDGTAYHAWIWPDEPRSSYLYDEDTNGAFLIRNSEYYEVDRTCEYMLVHFRLPSPRLRGSVFLNAAWTYDQFSPRYELEYNDEARQYEAIVSLKQGYYSYQYLLLQEDGTLAPVPSEGSFYQTENTYQAYVYFRGTTERTDRLVGFAEVRCN